MLSRARDIARSSSTSIVASPSSTVTDLAGSSPRCHRGVSHDRFNLHAFNTQSERREVAKTMTTTTTIVVAATTITMTTTTTMVKATLGTPRVRKRRSRQVYFPFRLVVLAPSQAISPDDISCSARHRAMYMWPVARVDRTRGSGLGRMADGHGGRRSISPVSLGGKGREEKRTGLRCRNCEPRASSLDSRRICQNSRIQPSGLGELCKTAVTSAPRIYDAHSYTRIIHTRSVVVAFRAVETSKHRRSLSHDYDVGS